MPLREYLSVLTFSGLIVGFCGGLISQLRKTSIDVPGGNEKRLTTFGKLALAVSMVGFAGSFGSELLKSWIAAQGARDSLRQREEEGLWKSRSTSLASEILTKTNSELEGILKTRFAIEDSRQKLMNDNLVRETRLYGRITAASAPLTDLRVDIVFPDLPPEMLHEIEKAKGEAWDTVRTQWPYVRDWISLTPTEEDAAVRDELAKRTVQPLIAFLATGEYTNMPAVLVLMLDNHFSSALPIGRAESAVAFNTENGTSLLPSGIRVADDPRIKRQSLREPVVHIDLQNKTVVLSIQLDEGSLNDAILRFSSGSLTTCTLSSEIELFAWESLHDDASLPFDVHGVDESFRAVDDPEDEEDAKRRLAWAQTGPKWGREISIRVVPNGVEEISRKYEMRPYFKGGLEGVSGEVVLWHGKAK